jgi:type VI secretion system protein ImpJ
MNLYKHRIAWTEGSLLEPQHFQQQERHFEHAMDARMRQTVANCRGFSSLTLDDALLEQGLVALTGGAGIFPDGTPFAFPADAPLPSPCDPGVDCVGEVICLAIPLDVSGAPLVDLSDAPAGARYRVAVAEVADRNRGIAPEASPPIAVLQVGLLQARLASRRAITTMEAALPVARIRERLGNGALRLDENFLPPLLDAHACASLPATINELLGLLTQRLLALGRPDTSASGTGGMSDLLELLLIQSLGEYRLLLGHLLHTRPLHPEALFRALLGLIGRLGATPGCETLALDATYRYDHDDPAAGFVPLVAALRRALSLVIEAPAVALDFRDRGDRIRVCATDPQLRLEKIVFVVAANAPAETLRTRFPAQAKFGPVEKIVQLIDLQLPGARMTAMPTPPRHVPYYPNSVYFEVDARDPLWPDTVSSAGMALSVVGDFPDLRIEAWGLRQGRIG